VYGGYGLMQDKRIVRFREEEEERRSKGPGGGLGSRSGAVGLLLVAIGLLATSCAQSPRLLHGSSSLDPGRGLVVFSVVVAGEPAEVSCTVHGTGVFAGWFGTERVLFGPSEAEGALPFGVPAVLSVPPGVVIVSVERIGDCWDFAGGRPRAEVKVAPDQIAYLGTLVVRWERGAAIEIRPIEEGRTERMPHSPAHGKPRWRYGVIRWSVHSEKDRVLTYLKERFDTGKRVFVEAEGAWGVSRRSFLW